MNFVPTPPVDAASPLPNAPSRIPGSDPSMRGSSAFKYTMDRCSPVDSLCAEHSHRGEDPHADPLNGALSQMLCHPSLPCIPLLNPYGLIRICHAPPAPLLINQVTNNIPAVLFNATSEFSRPGRRTASLSRQSGKKWQRGAADRETGGTVCACIFFFSGWKRLSVQTVAADHRPVQRRTSDRGFPMHSRCSYRKPVWTVHQM